MYETPPKSTIHPLRYVPQLRNYNLGSCADKHQEKSVRTLTEELTLKNHQATSGIAGGNFTNLSPDPSTNCRPSIVGLTRVWDVRFKGQGFKAWAFLLRF